MKIRDRLDSKYAKISAYAGFTVLIVAVALMLLYLTGGFWGSLWNVFVAVLKPLILGAVLCNLLTPLVNWFEKLFTKNGPRGWAKPVAVILTYLLILAAIIVLLLLVVMTVYKSISGISIKGIMAFFSSMGEDVTNFLQGIEKKLTGAGLPIDTVTGILGSLVSGLIDIFSLLLFGVIFSIYFLLDGQRLGAYYRRVFRVFAGDKNDEKLDLFLDDTNKVFSGYIRGEFLDAIVCAGLVTIIFLILGIPSPLVVGLLTGIGCLIPFCGMIVGCAATALVCIPGGDWKELIIGMIIIIVLIFIDGNVISPKLLSNSIEVHALLVIAALLGGGVVGGIVGMLVAIPVATLLKLQLDRYVEKKEKEKAGVQTSEEQ